MPFSIRTYEPADFDTLWRIDQDCFPSGIAYSRPELKLYLRRSAAFTLVAIGDGTSKPSEENNRAIAGFIVAEAGARSSGHIITIDVAAEARRSGVGSLLLRAAEDGLLARSCRNVALETAVDNLPALSFYKRHGYSVTRTFPGYYSNGVDALVLAKTLA